MSFNGYKSVIEEGHDVILYLTVNQIYCIKAEKKKLNKKGTLIDNVFQTPYGALKCEDLIGKHFGSKISLSKGWGYVLQPTPILWSQTLPHRTQIIYMPDMSMIIMQLDLCPGSVVIESGTGSGSLSHGFIRAIKPHGHLYTFDFHEERVKTATEEFKSHGLENFVTVKQQDVCANGFGDYLNQRADAVLLDLPHPWLAIPHAVKVLKDTGGRLGSFSPCIEQVQKSSLILSKLGFQEIQTVEVLKTYHKVVTRTQKVLNLDILKTERNGEVKEEVKEQETVQVMTTVPPDTQPGHTGYLTFATFPPVWARSLQINLNKQEMSEL